MSIGVPKIDRNLGGWGLGNVSILVGSPLGVGASQEGCKLIGRFVGGELFLAAWREVSLKGGGFGLPQRFMGARPVGGRGSPSLLLRG
jgi:hypothetical protein